MRGRATRQRFDVVFYTPWIGSILSLEAGSLPPGGAETQVLTLAKAMARHGAKVAIIVFGRADHLPDSVDGVSIIPRPPYRKKRFVGKVIETFLIWRALKRTLSPTIVVRAAGIELGLVGIYTMLSRRRLVYSSASIADFEPGKLITKQRNRAIYRLGVRLSSTIVVQTEEQIEMCMTLFKRQPELIKSIAPLAEPQSSPPEAFLWVGRLVSYKCPLEYVALARALPEARFWMVGVPSPPLGPNAEANAKMIETLTTEVDEVDNLDLLPPRSHDEIEQLMSRSIASVNTAEFEGMPNVLLEAWVRGVPALALHHDPGGVISTYGLGGFAQGSNDNLVALARGLWETRGNRSHVSERCRAYITEHHDPDVVARQWITVLVDGALGTDDLKSREGGVKLTCVE
jgi:glycosyltransferase involved in cell wall biosynthesis